MHKKPFSAKPFLGLRLGSALTVLPALPLLPFLPARRFGLVLRGLLGIAVLAASFAPQLSSFSFVSSAQAQAATPPNSGGQIYNNVPLWDMLATLAAIQKARPLLMAAMLP